MSNQARGLWHQSNFLKLWAGQTISSLGSGVTESALPLTAPGEAPAARDCP